MRSAYRLLLGVAFAAALGGPAAAADASQPPNYQGLWWNSPPGSESGWGIHLAHRGDAILGTWFTYDAAGNGWWLAVNAVKTAEGIFSGTVVECRGSAFSAIPYDPLVHARADIGGATLAFRDADNATFSYSVRGVQQTKNITRQAFGPLPACRYEAAPDLPAATNYTDVWWAASGGESGWEIDLAHQGDVIVALWSTYDGNRAPRWLVMAATRMAPGIYGGALVRTTGPGFGTQAFDPAAVTRTDAGTATLTFAHGNAATFAYTLDGVSRTHALTRQRLAPPAGTRCRATRDETVRGKVFDGYLEKAIVCADADANGRCDPGEAQALSDAAGNFELSAPPGFAGALVAEVVAGQSRETGPPGNAVDRSYRMASPSRDYSANVTPFTTLVMLARERDFRLAEEMVRNALGLPPAFALNLDSAPVEGSLARAVAGSVVAALKSTAETVGLASPEAFARVVEALPAALIDLPQLRIRTRDGAPIVSKEIYVDATFTLANPAAAAAQADLNGRIRGRGNTTWLLDKKPYKIQFTNDAAYAGISDVLGMRKNRNWALLADHLDRSLLRNKLAFTLGNSRLFADGLKWIPSGQHVEVTLNGDYVGVYLLSEDIRIDPARLGIRKMSANPAAREFDGGYIVEVDYPLDCYNQGAVNLQHVTPKGAHFCIDSPDEGAITSDQILYIKAYLDATEQDIYLRGTLERINPVSFADWYLLNELFRNQDAVFYSSDFMWKDTGAAAVPADRLLNMGPIWDFDLSAGNTNFFGNWDPHGCWVTKAMEMTPNWFGGLFGHRDFLDLVLARWKDKRAALGRLVESSLDAFARRLAQPQARNFARWPVLGRPNGTSRYDFPTWAAEVAFLRSFLAERMAWLDKAYASPEAFVELCK